LSSQVSDFVGFIKDRVLDCCFELSSGIFVLLDYHKLRLNKAFEHTASHILNHHIFWNFVPFYPDEKGKWRVST